MQKNNATAVRFYQKACDGNHFVACYNLGNLYKEGIAGKRDIEQSTHLFEKSCNGGLAPACHNLAANYIELKQYPTAEKYLIKACRLGLQESCQVLRQKN